MLDIKLIRENPEMVKANIARRGLDGKVIDELLILDKEKRALQFEVDELRSKKNLGSKKPTTEEIKELQKTKLEIDDGEKKLKKVETEWIAIMNKLPNLLSDDVPAGKDESENKVIRQVGEKPKFDFTPMTHEVIGEKLGIIDTQTAAEVTGTRFAYIKGKLVLLQMAILNFAWSVLTDEKLLSKIAEENSLDVSTKPFTPVLPPVLIKEEILAKMARLEPKDERYQTTEDGLFLIGSAEHTMGPMLMDKIIPEDELPIRFAGYSSSFRREAGSYGKDMKGIFRMHQFEKLEMETFSRPEDSIMEQNFLVAIQEYMVQQLKIPYQLVMICTGDIGNPDFRQIDIECWLPGQNKYRETHTSDLMTDYQARRLNTRFVRTKNNEKEFLHMNDATVFSMRPLIAILENYQQADGSVKIPEVLWKYTGFKEIKKK